MKSKEILQLNAYLKFIEFVLECFDNENGDMRLDEIRKKFKNHFKVLPPLCNQHFGIIRLIPLLLMKEFYKKEKMTSVPEIKKINIIRNSLAHHDFIINEKGYIFLNGKDKLKISYNDFQIFLHKIENSFYT